MGNSNIGTITMQTGGSGRNMAECLARLGYHSTIFLISAIAKDDPKNTLIEHTMADIRLSMAGVIHLPGSTSVFNGILDNHGDYLLGIADMDILETISIHHINHFKQ
jgi:sugar/nucleoside kinase (ribokinase family)